MMRMRVEPVHILGILAGESFQARPAFPTAQIRARLRSPHYSRAARIPQAYPRALDTATVKRELERMRNAGLVRREDDFYWPHLAWRMTDEGARVLAGATSCETANESANP